MSHWIVSAAVKAGLQGAETLHLHAATPAPEAWKAAQGACGCSGDEIAAAVAGAFGMEVADFDLAEPTAERLLSGSIARKLGVFPLRDEDRFLLVATADPVDPRAEQEVSFASGRSARLSIAAPERIAEAIERAYSADVAAASLLSRVDDDFGGAGEVELDSALDEEPEKVSEEEIAAGPIVRLTNILLHEAVARGASDIHIQPMARHGLVRYRSDGVLHNGMQMPLPVLTRVVSRIKIMARLDITDRLRPQDGRARILVGGKKYDLRVSTVPTRRAEKAVIRVLDTQGTGTLDEIGIYEDEVARLRTALSHRDGIIVVTGPTGSGKTTTLYAALREISTEGVNIMTVEDPVEYELPRLTQIQVEHKQGMTFASALRAILRQDPDVIFVGEIRDGETADIAAQASLTGHLVLSSLHTNDAVGAIRRFLDLGLDPGTLTETMRASLAQRLVRKVCEHCAAPVGEDMEDRERRLSEQYRVRPTVRAVGCDRCVGQGYMGRLPVTEFMVSTPALVRLVLDGAAPIELQRQAQQDGMVTILDSALRLVRAGLTTLDEVERVVGGAPGNDITDTPTPGTSAADAQAPAPRQPPPSQTDAAVGREAVTPTPPSPAIEPAPSRAPPATEPPPAFSTPPGSEPTDPSTLAPAAQAPLAPGGETIPSAPSDALSRSQTETYGSSTSPASAPAADQPSASTASADTLSHGPTTPYVDVAPEPASPVSSEPPESSFAFVPQDQAGTTILLVDDDPTTRLMGRALLEKEGFHVEETPDGGEALLRLARRETFHLMVLDLDMPRMGGREVLQAVRRSIATAGLPVIVLTGTPDRGTETELMELGADDYLRKPIDPSVFLARIRAALYRAAG